MKELGRPCGQPALVADATGAASVSAHPGDGQAYGDIALTPDQVAGRKYLREVRDYHGFAGMSASELCGE